MSDPLEIPGEVWDEEYYPDLPLNVCFWRRGPPEIVYDDEEVPEQEFAFEEGSVSITVNYLLKAYRAHQDSVREERRAVTDTAVEQGEFVLHRPPDEDVHVPLTRGAFADVSTCEYNFVRGYILHSAARFWQEHLPDWRHTRVIWGRRYPLQCAPFPPAPPAPPCRGRPLLPPSSCAPCAPHP